ncbi:hypothetical protein ACH5RR_005971 [Cinchona calisaya]|uniref:tRNA(Ile)-lysidine synthetase n=1 Tax=Cinchona calisaya TaxID=153742 RepID=A0ABD3AMN6_9GENT
MARRGLIIASSSSSSSSHSIFTSFSTTLQLSNHPKRPPPLPYSSSCSPRLRFPFIHSSRFFCNFSKNQHGPVDLSNYKETFARRMAMAGLKRHHRLALGVSGGPDSVALCVLAAMWTRDANSSIGLNDSSGFIEGLMAIVVDHGLRPESRDEANLVCRRVTNMGIRCETACCEWFEGRPKQGHLQEAARDKRYELLQNVCIQHQIGVLLIAHHADDQAELFILRLSRGSGVLGLSGTAFVSQLFVKSPDYSSEAINEHGILLVRPLLEFSKEDMYQICQGGNQEWVEDPTNRSSLFARNRIRKSLRNLLSCEYITAVFKDELQAVISACRRTRLHVDKVCSDLINQAVTIMPEGYAVINLQILNPSSVDDICLSKFLTFILQFISQKHRPVRGSATKLLFDYIRTSPCKTCLTAAGCYLSPSPGSKGSKILICCSVDSNVPLRMEMIHTHSNERQNCSISSEVQQIVENAKSFQDKFIFGVSDVQPLGSTSSQLLGLKSSESVLNEAKRLGILSNSSYDTIFSLQNQESEYFKPGPEVMIDHELKDEGKLIHKTASTTIHPGQACYLMKRFLIKWNLCGKTPYNIYSSDEIDAVKGWKVGRQQCCSSCVVDHDNVAELRFMVDTDWLYLAKLSKSQEVGYFPGQILSATATEKDAWKIKLWSEFVKLSAHRALLSLKSIPVCARRALPVLVDSQGLLLSIPSVGFQHCPCLTVSAVFKPRVPIGGGFSSFL